MENRHQSDWKALITGITFAPYFVITGWLAFRPFMNESPFLESLYFAFFATYSFAFIGCLLLGPILFFLFRKLGYLNNLCLLQKGIRQLIFGKHQ
jgi:hypothetical protein